MAHAGIDRVLIVHNRYLIAAQSGEDRVYEDEANALERQGIEVIRLEVSNAVLAEGGVQNRIRAAAASVWSRRVYRDTRKRINLSKPDVAHFHNVFPQFGPAAMAACRDEGVAVVQTLHNYRWRCASGLLLRDSKPCELCWSGSPLAGVKYRCYQDSVSASLVAMIAQWNNRRLFHKDRTADLFIALTEFSRQQHIQAGIPPERIRVKGNTVANDPGTGDGSGGYVLFVGRFGPEKGIETLLSTWKRLGREAPPLKMIGRGPLANGLEESISNDSLNIELLGPAARSAVIAAMKSAMAVVFPSICYEGFPLVLAEALACGTPVIGTRTGGIPEILNDGVNGLLFPRQDSEALAKCVTRIASDAEERARMRNAARNSFESSFSQAKNIGALLSIYSEAKALKACGD